jgi:hypothetical protein
VQSEPGALVGCRRIPSAYRADNGEDALVAKGLLAGGVLGDEIGPDAPQGASEAAITADPFRVGRRCKALRQRS